MKTMEHFFSNKMCSDLRPSQNYRQAQSDWACAQVLQNKKNQSIKK